MIFWIVVKLTWSIHLLSRQVAVYRATLRYLKVFKIAYQKTDFPWFFSEEKIFEVEKLMSLLILFSWKPNCWQISYLGKWFIKLSNTSEIRPHRKYVWKSSLENKKIIREIWQINMQLLWYFCVWMGKNYQKFHSTVYNKVSLVWF